MQIYVNKTENRVIFKINNGYSLELLTSETMKLLGSTENKITKDKNGENVPHLEITEVVLVHCDIVNNDYQQDSRVLYTFVPNKPFGSLLEISLKITLIFSLITGITKKLLNVTTKKKKKHNKIVMLAKSKLNSVET